MTFTFPSWSGQLLLPSRRPAPDALPVGKPMKIEVQRLPDYRWRELGFVQPHRPGEDR
jgi:hypothetical protein